MMLQNKYKACFTLSAFREMHSMCGQISQQHIQQPLAVNNFTAIDTSAVSTLCCHLVATHNLQVDWQHMQEHMEAQRSR